jgi:hypothetical protein
MNSILPENKDFIALESPKDVGNCCVVAIGNPVGLWLW